MELEDLITSFKSANQSLRKRALALGVLMIIAVGLRFAETARSEKVSNLLTYQSALASIADLPDSTFRALIDGNTDLEKEYFPMTDFNQEMVFHYRLMEKIRLNNYGREPLILEINDIDKKILDENRQQSISLLGLTIPLEPVAHLSLIFVLIVFHDFTQIMVIRNQVYRRISHQKLSQWKLGTEFFGFYFSGNNSTLKFIRFTSSLITGVFVLCPIVTSYFMMYVNNSQNSIWLILNITCFLIIVIDSVLIFYVENIAGFRYFSNFYLGRHSASASKMVAIWAISISFFIVTNLGLSIALIQDLGYPGVEYLLMTTVPPVALFFVLIAAKKNPSKIIRALRTCLLMINLFLVVVSIRAFSIAYRLTKFEIHEVKENVIVVTIFCLVYSFIYMRFFMHGKKASRKRS